MSWQPNATVAVAKRRARMLQVARQHFLERNVLEVCTPSLTGRTVTDPNIESLVVADGDRRCYLHTSPEYFMKRLLAAGYPDMYQIGAVFRGGEKGRRHLPEFTMIEWYRLGLGLHEIIGDTVDLVSAMVLPVAAADVVSYQQAFASALAIDPLSASAIEVADVLDADDNLRRSMDNDLDAWLDLAMATAVAASFAPDRLTAVFHYPASQASLARLSPHDERVAERFELYCGSLELANGFVELADADEQLRRFERDREERRAAGKALPAIDDEFIAALRCGLPPCAGVALGFDRLLMIDRGLNDIHEVITFTPGIADDD